MESHKRISELLLETGAYKDLDKPVILTSGELGIYYVNTEKLAQDNGEFEKYGDSSQNMIKHAVNMMTAHQTFEEAIDILAEKVRSLIPGEGKTGYVGVSGGQRRDWLFSGPVANKLGLPHLSLYKQEDGKPDVMEIVTPEGRIDYDSSARGIYVVHVVDLITEGSSVYSCKDGKEKGWAPMIRAERSGRTGAINDLVAVVTRQQGGEEMLARQYVRVHPFVAIDENFLGKYSKDPERALKYQANPTAWSEDYLSRNGALVLLKSFDPKGGKLDRAKKFLGRYQDTLVESGRFEELDNAVKQEYGISLNSLGGK